MFSVHATPDEFRNATIIDQFGFVFEENSLGKSQDYLHTNRFWKSVFKITVYTKMSSRRFEILLFEKRFQKASFSWRISVDGRPNRRNKAAF